MQSRYRQNDPNQIFFSALMNHQSEVDRDISKEVIKQRMRSILAKLQDLTKEEREEWQSIHLNKLNHLLLRLQSSKDRGKALREGLRCLVLLCSSAGIEYDRKEVQRITKATYSYIYGKRAINLLGSAGYSVHDFQVLEYEEPISWKFLCCCSIFGGQ